MSYKAHTTYIKGKDFRETPFTFASTEETEGYLDQACEQNIHIADYKIVEVQTPVTHKFSEGKLMRVMA